MNFANPLFFWTFLSLVPLIAIYLLKVRPVRKPTTAYFLWDEIFQEKSSNSLFQRFRDLFSLLLMALVFAAVALALTGPSLKNEKQKDLLLLIDNSASMNAKDGLGSRLDAAKNAASKIIESLNGTQRCSVAAISTSVTYLSNLTDNPRELLSAVDSIQPTSLPFDSDSLTPITASNSPTNNTDPQEPTTPSTQSSENPEQKNTTNDHRIILFSDGLIGAEIPTSLELQKVGNHRLENIGIVACDIQLLPGQSHASVFCQLASSQNDVKEVELSVSSGTPNNLVKLVPIEVQPGINKPFVFQIENAATGRWYFELDIDDALADDNVAFAVIPSAKPIRVGVAASEKFFYENSVIAFSQSGGLLQLAKDNCQMLIGQGTEVNQLNSNTDTTIQPDLMIFKPAGESTWWQNIGEEIEVALPRILDEDHPVFRHFDASTIPFIGARRITAPPGADVWVAAEDGTPLIYKLNRSGVSTVVVNLDPLESNLYFSAWFPIIIYSTAQHLAGRTDNIKSSYATWQTAPIPGASEFSNAAIQTPSGENFVTQSNFTPPLSEPGFYQLKTDRETNEVGCSLLSKTESMINNSKIVETIEPIGSGTSWVKLLTIVAISAVCLESFLYQRRKVG